MFVARRAARARRSPARWFVYGAILGPVAVAILQAAPPGTCGICLAPVAGWGFQCAACGADVRARPAIGRSPTTSEVPDSDILPHLEELVRAGRAAEAGAPSPAPAAAQPPSVPVAAAAPRTGEHRDVVPAAIPAPVADRGGSATGSGVRTSRAGLRGPRRTPGGPAPVALATGIFVEGSEPMVPGATYALHLQGDDLRVTGPVNARPGHIVVSRRLRELATTALGDRLIITGASRRLDDFYIVLAALTGGSAQTVARALDQARLGASEPRQVAR